MLMTTLSNKYVGHMFADVKAGITSHIWYFLSCQGPYNCTMKLANIIIIK